MKVRKPFDLKKKENIKILNDLYSNLKFPSAFSGINSLLTQSRKYFTNIKLEDIKKNLRSQESYTLHKLTPRKFKQYRKVIAATPKIIVSLDLIDMNKLSKFNDGYKYLMFFIDVFSRKNTVIPIRTKSKIDILQGLKVFLNINDNKAYSRIYSDLESSLYSKEVQEYLHSNKISTYSNSSYETKNSLAEIGLKYLKRKIYMYLTHYATNRYIDVLEDIVSGINTSTKSIFKNKFLTPEILHNIKKNEFLREMFQSMYNINRNFKEKNNHSLKINQLVRIPYTGRTQDIFHKSHNIVNTEEIFKIVEIDKKKRPFLYKLEDLSGERIKGSFYGEELTPSEFKKIYPIKILKEKTVKGRKYLYISWINWPSKYDQWIDSRELV